MKVVSGDTICTVFRRELAWPPYCLAVVFQTCCGLTWLWLRAVQPGAAGSVCLFVCLFVHGLPTLYKRHCTKYGTYTTQGRRASLKAGRRDPFCVPDTDPSLGRAPEESALQGSRCRECVEDAQWGVCSLAEPMLTFGNTQCLAKSAMYSVLTYFHADTRLPEACFLHSCVPLGADLDDNIKDASLVDDLWHRQNHRLAAGGDLHSKLHRLLDPTLTMGDFWSCPDMMAENHAATARHRLKRTLLSFRAKRLWPVVEQARAQHSLSCWPVPSSSGFSLNLACKSR